MLAIDVHSRCLLPVTVNGAIFRLRPATPTPGHRRNLPQMQTSNPELIPAEIDRLNCFENHKLLLQLT
jgi:hypothetical protein